MSNTSVVAYKLLLPSSKKQDIFIVKRYDFNEIEKFLSKHFKLIEPFNGLTSDKLEKSDRGIFLLQKK